MKMKNMGKNTELSTKENAIVRLDSVSKSYVLGETRVRALRELSLSLRRGEFTALVGASGSGKSTLLNLVGALDTPDSGKIFFDEKDLSGLTEIDRSQLRNQHIGYIFQSFNLIPVLNVEENIELPLHINNRLSAQEKKERVKEALADVGLTAYAQQVPNKLSGGQRQRVAIARALVTQPDLILADEPTANLDSQTAHKIIDLLLDLNAKKNVTCFFCTHDEKLIGRVTRLIRIQDGDIVE